MAKRYRERILEYCTGQGIEVPPGYGRNTPSRYAIIRTDVTPNKLVAKTWFKVADVIYYLERILAPEVGERVNESIRILDFDENQQLEWNGSKQLKLKAPL